MGSGRKVLRDGLAAGPEGNAGLAVPEQVHRELKHRKMLQVNTVGALPVKHPAQRGTFLFFHMIAISPTLRSNSLPQQILQEEAAQEAPSSKWLEHPGDLPGMWGGGGGVPFQTLTFVSDVPSV